MDAFPTLTRYLHGLPHGLASYPEVQQKASVARNMLESLPERMDADGLPAPIAKLVEDPPPPSVWIPEAHGLGALLAIRDLFADDEQFLAHVRQATVALLSSPMYRMMMRLMSPRFLFQAGARSWGKFHHGIEMEMLDVTGSSASLHLNYRPGLVDQLLARAFAMAFEVALSLSGSDGVEVVVKHWSADQASIVGRWK